MGIGRKRKKERQNDDSVKKQARKREKLITLMTMMLKGSYDNNSVYRKRSRQLKHIRQILQMTIRIINAMDRKTVYRR